MSTQLSTWRAVAAFALALPLGLNAADRVHTASGTVEGATSADGKIQIFKGIPFAAPPVGSLRWKEPQPVAAWEGVRKTTEFTPRCMQARIYNDMVFRDPEPSEDCLYLNIWAPKDAGKAKLPVMVWIYGGGFQAGAASEPRQDGENLAHKGVLVVSLNYRLGVFGFFSHPELTKESPHHASGNYGLLDQAAALAWVHKNIAAFGGDPNKVTIFGESAGSFSVCALMASPLSKHLIRSAIGESGAFFGRTLSAKTLAESEEANAKFGAAAGAGSIEALRALSAQQVLDAASKAKGLRFAPNIDGYFLPSSPAEIFANGQQAHIPLLAGWNHDEGSYRQFFGKDAPTQDNFTAKIRETFGDRATEALELFPAGSDEQLKQSAGLLATASFIGYGTWKWIDVQKQTGGSAVYRYEFDQAPPAAADATPPAADRGAYHSAEIEYVFGTLDSKKLPWRPEDHKLSEQMGAYWTNFAKTGDPNGTGLPQWPQYQQKDSYQVLHLRPNPHATADNQRRQYMLLDKAASEPSPAATTR